MSGSDAVLPAAESAVERLARSSDRFEVFARAGDAFALRRDPSGDWERRHTREVGVACRVVARGEAGFAAAAGGSARAGREAAEAALAGLGPGPDPLPPAHVLGATACPTERVRATPEEVEGFARGVAEAVRSRHAGVALLDLRVLAASSETCLLTAEGFVTRARAAGVTVELLLAAQQGPARLLHLAARRLPDLVPADIAERAVETVLLVACGAAPAPRLVDVVAAPSVAAELVAALARELIRCRLAGEPHLQRAHVSPAWVLVDERAGPAGLLPLPFDAEGLPSRTAVLLRDGHRHEPPLTWAEAGARQAGAGGAVRPSYRTPPVSAPANLVVQATPSSSPRDLLERLGDGLYLALPEGSVRVEAETGRFALRAAAVAVRSGRPVAPHPLVEVRGSFRRLLGALEACSAETESFALTCAVTTPSLLLRRLELA